MLYQYRENAEEAIAHMHEGQIDGAVINVSIVLPRRTFSPEPPLARRGANIDPRVPIGAPRGGRGPRGFSGPGGHYTGGGPGRHRPPSPGRFGQRVHAYQGPERSRSRSRSPVRSPPRGRSGGYRQRSASFDSYSSRSRSKSPPPRRGGGGSELSGLGGGPRRRSRSFVSYAGRNRSISPRRGHR